MLSNLTGRVGDVLGRVTARLRSRPSREAFGHVGSVRLQDCRRRDSDGRLETDVAVLGRAALFGFATIARATGRSDVGTPGRRLRENGPAVLVPLAWSFAITAHLGLASDRTVLIAHLVMDAILATFAAASWSEMTTGVLRAWKVVLLVGLGATLSGTAALRRTGEEATETTTTTDRTLSLTVLAWMLVPAAGLAYTGLGVDSDEGPQIYLVGAVCSAFGAVAYASAPMDAPTSRRKLLGLALANVGQTAGIVNAVYQY